MPGVPAEGEFMKHPETPTPDDDTIYPVHSEAADPEFTDKYYFVGLDVHTRLRNTFNSRRDNMFQCRVRQWKFGAPNAEKLRFFMISGIGHSCHFFSALVKCMSLDEAFANRSVEVYALDLPGHGASQSPPNIQFGMLRLEDYVDVIRQIMDELKNEEKAIDYVVAHSMGGMLAQLVEKSLQQVDTSFNDRYQTTGVILFASSLPERIDWSLGEGYGIEKGVPARLLTMLLPFVTYSPRYALHGRISNEDFLKTFFAVTKEDDAGNTEEEQDNKDDGVVVRIVPGAPVGDAVTLMNSAEAYVALSELAGLDLQRFGILRRPFVREGLFSEYKLGVAGYTKDILFLPKEERELSEHLSSDKEKSIYRTIDHVHAVHDDPYSFPCASFRFLADVVAMAKK